MIKQKTHTVIKNKFEQAQANIEIKKTELEEVPEAEPTPPQSSVREPAPPEEPKTAVTIPISALIGSGESTPEESIQRLPDRGLT